MSVAPDEIHRLTVDDVLGMVDAGVLDEDARVELWGGVLVDMSPEGDDHIEAVRRLTEALVLAYTGTASVYVQSTLRFSAPDEFREPDLAVVLDPRHRGGPRGDQTALAVEIASTSQLRGRRKLAFYAREGVGEVWLVDLVRETVAMHRRPTADGYTETGEVGRDGALALPGSDRTIPADACFPEATPPQ